VSVLSVGCLLYITEATISRNVRCVGKKGAVFNLKRTAVCAENSATSEWARSMDDPIGSRGVGSGSRTKD
jgi:hypothetical protein